MDCKIFFFSSNLVGRIFFYSSARIFFYYICAACNFFLPTIACRKFFFKITHPPPPSRVKWSTPNPPFLTCPGFCCGTWCENVTPPTRGLGISVFGYPRTESLVIWVSPSKMAAAFWVSPGTLRTYLNH